MRTIYLDNNATTRVSQDVLEVMWPIQRSLYGNPSSVHTFGSQVAEKLEEAREQVAALLGVSAKEILFTSGGTESDNTAIRSALELSPEKRHIVTSAVEHPAIRSLYHYYSKRGYRVTEVPVNSDGELDLDFYEQQLTPDTAVVSLMWANNETGVIFPVEKAALLAHEKGIPFHTDAVQAVGRVPINLKDSPVDMLSLSGHKLHGPKGIGALYIRKGTRFRPTIRGAIRKEAVAQGPKIHQLSWDWVRPANWLLRSWMGKTPELKKLRDKLEGGVLAKVPSTQINGHNAPRLPNTTNISFEYVEGEGVLLLLDELGIYASSGSACTSGSLEPSHVLLAMGVSAFLAQGAVRFSLSTYNSNEEIDFVLRKFRGSFKSFGTFHPCGLMREDVCPVPLNRFLLLKR